MTNKYKLQNQNAIRKKIQQLWRAYKAEHGSTQKELAEFIGVSQPIISAYLSGRCTNQASPNPMQLNEPFLRGFCAFVGVEYNKLLREC